MSEVGNHFLEYSDWAIRYETLLRKAGRLLTKELKKVNGLFCLMCAEIDAERCHRKILSEYLIRHGFEFVKHL